MSRPNNFAQMSTSNMSGYIILIIKNKIEYLRVFNGFLEF